MAARDAPQLIRNEAPARPAHHRAGGGFRNPPGSPTQVATLRDMLKFLLVDMRRGAVFREIGERTDPFDLAIVGIGAFEPRVIMQSSHARPEEAIGIARDLRAAKPLGMHWAPSCRPPENPFEAPARFRQAALEQQFGEANAVTLPMGGTLAF